MPIRTLQRPPEAGFTVIEVVIAILLVAALATTVTLATAGSSRVHQTTSLKQQATDVAEATYEQMRSDTSWEQSCPALSTSTSGSNVRLTAPCPGTSHIRRTMTSNGTLHNSDLNVTFQLTTLEARAVDDPSDGLGAADRDGKLPDYYQVKITVGLSAADQRRLGRFSPISLTSTIDPGSSSNDQGSLVVSFCNAINQIDERITTAGCDDGNTDLKMVGCVPGTDCTPWQAVFGNRADDVHGNDYVVEQSTLPSCTIVGPVSRSCSMRWPNTGRQTGYLFTSLPSGTYTVHFSAPRGYKPWTTHFLPAATTSGHNLEVTVNANQRNRALALFQPTGHSNITFRYRHVDSNALYDGNINGTMVTFSPYCVDHPDASMYGEGPAVYGPYYHSYPEPGAPGPAIDECTYEPKTETVKTYLNGVYGTYAISGRVGHTHSVSYGEEIGPNLDEYFKTTYDSWAYYVVSIKYKEIKYDGTQLSGRLPGASDNAAFSTAPAPFGRLITPQKDNTPASATSVDQHSTWQSFGGTAAENDLSPKTGTTDQILPFGLNAPIHKDITTNAGDISVTPSGALGCRYIWVRRSDANPYCDGVTNIRTVTLTGHGDCYATLRNAPWTYTKHHNYTANDGSPDCSQQCLYYPPNNVHCCGTGHLIYEVDKQKIMYENYTYHTDATSDEPAFNMAGSTPPYVLGFSPEPTPTVTHPDVVGMSDCGPPRPVTVSWVHSSGPSPGHHLPPPGSDAGTRVVPVN